MSDYMAQKADEQIEAGLSERDSMLSKIDSLISEINTLTAKVERYEVALTSIASLHRPRHIEKQYWVDIGIDNCATCLAMDTPIARKALAGKKNE